MIFDPLSELTQPGSNLRVHNARLIDAQQSETGQTLLTIEHAGNTRELIGAGPWSEELSRRDVGQIGYVVAAKPFGEAPAGGCYFRPYIDQSLRRVPELDRFEQVSGDEGTQPEVIGWCCDAKPGGFRAPVGIVPGEDGRFVPDETIEVTLRVPPEFVREAHQVQMTPAELLRSFVGDLAGIQNFTACPRADRYGSNGSDERDYAEAWLHRAHGFNAIDLDALENRAREDQERQWQRDEFADLLDEFESAGGQADDLFAAVQAILDKQEKG